MYATFRLLVVLILTTVLYSCSNYKPGLELKEDNIASLKGNIVGVTIKRYDTNRLVGDCLCWSQNQNYQLFIDQNFYLDGFEEKWYDSLSVTNSMHEYDSLRKEFKRLRPKSSKVFELSEENDLIFYERSEEYSENYYSSIPEEEYLFSSILIPNRFYEMRVLNGNVPRSHSTNSYSEVFYFMTDRNGKLEFIQYEYLRHISFRKIKL